MKILVIDHMRMFGGNVAARLAKDGHDVVYVPIFGGDSEKIESVLLMQNIERVRPYREGWWDWLDKVDFSVVVGNGHKGYITDEIRKKGKLVVGAGSWGAELELNRGFGFKVFSEMGLKIPDFEKFSNVQDAIRYVKKHPNRYVVKIDQTFRALAETFVGRDPNGTDVLGHLETLASKISFSTDELSFYLQEFIEGSEVSVTGLFNGKTFLDGFQISYESAHGFVYDLRYDGDLLLDRKAVERVLAKAGFQGFIDINGILSEGVFRPIEFTPRWGKGMTEFLCFTAKDLGAVLHATATGKEATPFVSVRGKVVALINAMVEPQKGVTSVEVKAPKGLPDIRKDAAFMVEWMCRGSDGKWIAFPNEEERRLGMYVGLGADLDAALKKCKDLSSEVFIPDSGMAPAQLKADVEGRMDRVSRFFQKEEWITDVAEEMRHVWQR